MGFYSRPGGILVSELVCPPSWETLNYGEKKRAANECVNGAERILAPRVESSLREDGTVDLWVDMPGVSKDDVTVEATGAELTVGGSRKRNTPNTEAANEASGDNRDTKVKEGAHHDRVVNLRYSTTIKIRNTMDLSRTSAIMEDGVLHLAIPPKPEVAPLRITIA